MMRGEILTRSTGLRSITTVFGVSLLLTACARPTTDIAAVDYSPPEGRPALPARIAFAGDESAAISESAQAIRRAGLDIEKTDIANGLLIATYIGDAERYLDCGTLRTDPNLPPQPAAAAQIRLRPFSEQPSWLALRQMRLDARLVARTRAGESMSQLNSSATYVLTRTVDTLSADGAVLGSVRETIGFESGGVGRFGNGTTCLSNGVLEREVADAMVAAATGPLPDGIVTTAELEERATLSASELRELEPAAGPVETHSLPATPPAPSGASTAASSASTASAGAATEAVGAAAAGTVAVATTALPGDAAPEVEPTAALEPPEVYLASLPCADVALVSRGGGDLLLTGYIAGSEERSSLLAGLDERVAGAAVKDETSLLPPGSCEALRLEREIGSANVPGLAIALSEAQSPLDSGTEVVLEVTLPGADRYFYVGYIEEDGTVRHLGPQYIDSRGIGDRFLYKTGYEVGGAAGTELIVAIASRAPVFTEDQGSSENAAGFFSGLREALASSTESTAVTKLVVETRAR